jgi:alkylglycerol monooxygenase
MDSYGLILLIAIPFFVVLIVAELFAYKIKKLEYNHIDSYASLYSGMTNTIKDVLGLVIVIFSYDFLLDNLWHFSIGKTQMHLPIFWHLLSWTLEAIGIIDYHMR